MISDSRTALLIILHGSPREEANVPAIRLAERLREQNRFQDVHVAYMECNEPSIPKAIEQCASQGASKIIALPWFLHAGRHLVLDVPELLISGGASYPEVQILITDPIGTSDRLADVLALRADEAIAKSTGPDSRK